MRARQLSNGASPAVAAPTRMSATRKPRGTGWEPKSEGPPLVETRTESASQRTGAAIRATVNQPRRSTKVGDAVTGGPSVARSGPTVWVATIAAAPTSGSANQRVVTETESALNSRRPVNTTPPSATSAWRSAPSKGAGMAVTSTIPSTSATARPLKANVSTRATPRIVDQGTMNASRVVGPTTVTSTGSPWSTIQARIVVSSVST